MNSGVTQHVGDFINELNSIDIQCESNQKIYVRGSFFTKLIQLGLIGLNGYAVYTLNESNKTDRIKTIKSTSAIFSGMALADFCWDLFNKEQNELCNDQVKESYKILIRKVNKIEGTKEIRDVLEESYNSFSHPNISEKTSSLHIFSLGLVKNIERFFTNIFSFIKPSIIPDIIKYLRENVFNFSGRLFFLYEGTRRIDQFENQISFMLFIATIVFVYHAYHLLFIATSKNQLRLNMDYFIKSIKKYAPTVSLIAH